MCRYVQKCISGLVLVVVWQRAFDVQWSVGEERGPPDFPCESPVQLFQEEHPWCGVVWGDHVMCA